MIFKIIVTVWIGLIVAWALVTISNPIETNEDYEKDAHDPY